MTEGKPVPAKRAKRSDDERFWDRVFPEPNSGCWLWLGNCSYQGYGSFSSGGKNRPAHRWSYERFVGLIPAGLVIDHLCRVRCCVNPDHLEPVSNRENILRGYGAPALNATKTHCIHGHEFTPENTRIDIRNGAVYGRGCLTCDHSRSHHKKAA